MGSGHDITDSKRIERTIMYQAAFDPLTGVFNRGHFRSRLERSLADARRDRKELTLAVMSIDQFDATHASYGPDVVEEVVRSVVARIKAVVPGDLVVGRIATDAFALVIPSGAFGDVRAFTDAVLKQFEEPFLAVDRELHVGVSVGTATFPFDGRTADHLIRSATVAARRAQELGGRRSQYFFGSLDTDSTAHVAFEDDLWRAIEREEFFLMYQPQISLENGAIDGVEVLLRWRRNGEILPASEFISRLEHTALIVPLGRWVIDTALEQFREWRDNGIELRRMSVNVGARQLGDESFLPAIRRSLARYDVAPHLLDLEITETAAMVNAETSVRTLQALRQLGIEVTIDDFGAGYSSLGYLRRFPITGLKIDRSFIAKLPQSRTEAAIIRAVIATAVALNLRLVAEGVECEEQAAWLAQAGCRSAQGFLYSRPLTAEDAGNFLKSGRTR